MEIPRKAKNLPENLFLFNEKNRDFVAGKASQPYLGSQKKVYWFGLLFFTMIALPISVILSVAIALLTQFALVQVLTFAIAFASIATVFIMFVSYRLRRKLTSSKTILIGEVTRYEDTVAGSLKGYTGGTRLWYTFINPDGVTKTAMLLVSSNREILPDGRGFPDIGTPIAVIYADDKVFSLL